MPRSEKRVSLSYQLAFFPFIVNSYLILTVHWVLTEITCDNFVQEIYCVHIGFYLVLLFLVISVVLEERASNTMGKLGEANEGSGREGFFQSGRGLMWC